jgi:hypothetical protein
LSGVPYEISEYPSSFLMYDCRLMTPTKYYAHRLTQKVFLKTVQIFKPLIHEKEYEDILLPIPKTMMEKTRSMRQFSWLKKCLLL